MTVHATVLGLSVLILGVGGQERHRLDGAEFGAKSSYFPVANTDDSPLEVEGCTPALLWMYVRHGTRNPGARDMAKMEALLPGLRDQLVAAWQRGRSELAEEDFVKMLQWKFTLKPEDEGLLTE